MVPELNLNLQAQTFLWPTRFTFTSLVAHSAIVT
jgi:hypothetical protein